MTSRLICDVLDEALTSLLILRRPETPCILVLAGSSISSLVTSSSDEPLVQYKEALLIQYSLQKRKLLSQPCRSRWLCLHFDILVQVRHQIDGSRLSDYTGSRIYLLSTTSALHLVLTFTTCLRRAAISGMPPSHALPRNTRLHQCSHCSA